MKKILIITSEFPPLPGGIGNHAFLLAKYLQKKDYYVSVVTDFRSSSEDYEFDSKQLFKVYRIKRSRLTQLNRLKKSFLCAKKNEIIICSGKFSLWIGGLLKIFFKHAKVLAVIHGSELKAGGKISQYLTKWSLSQFDELIAVSNFTKQVALSINDKLKIEVINNGIEFRTYPSKVFKEGELHVVTVGNLTFRKGQQNVIRALPLLKQKFNNIHFHCVGIPTEKEKFKDLAISLKVENVVTFHGALPDNEKEKVMQNATIFMMLSDIVRNDFEGFGIAVLEANSMGLPAIGSENSGIADAINSGKSGFLVHPHSPEAIVKAVDKILEDYELFSKQAIQHANGFDWHKIISMYETIIER